MKSRCVSFARKMSRNALLSLATVVIVSSVSSCQKLEVSSQHDKVVVPVNFNFETTHALELSLKVMDFEDNPVQGTVWTAYYQNPYDTLGSIVAGANKIATFVTDYDGVALNRFNVPGHVSQIFLTTSYPGYASPVIIDTNAQTLSLTVYPAGHAGNILKSAVEDGEKFNPGQLFDNVYKLSSFDAMGLPTYREATRDLISAQFKSNINTSLPEYSHLPVSNRKSFLDDATKANIQLNDKCEVWITFVTEGAGFKNTLGYFYYPTNTPPAAISKIKRKYVVFPNTSLLNSGGSLVEGDKVKLRYCDEVTDKWSDIFPANYTISWFLIPNGFTTSGSNGRISLPSGYNILYSIAGFNPLTMQQSVILYDENEKKMLIAFEDTQRNVAGTAGDEDFNDAVFYATANPITAINIDHFNKIVEANDTDKDGVLDIDDEYPEDAKRASKSYYPAQNTWGTLCYEDQWPNRGDYDFNDVVVDYNTTIVKNASGLVVDVNTNYRFRAAGASFKNAFAVQFNTAADNVESVTGSQIAGGLFTLNANGTESKQVKAVVPITDNINTLFGDKTLVNTELAGTKVPSVIVPINVTFKTAVSLATLGGAPYNPFLLVNRKRGIEIHLPGQQPTDLVNMSLLSTGLDLTNFSLNRFYVADQSYPWALHIPSLFEYPIEQHAIDNVFYNFGKWVTSGGVLSPAWYQNNANNADQSKIYK